MIISASRRTDIPAFYAGWLFNRLSAGFVLVRNPRDQRQVGRISLSPRVIDCLVFWTRDARPMLGRLRKLAAYSYYFQVTLTPYGRDVEPLSPPKKALTEGFMALAKAVGRERVIWRYDPVLLGGPYTAAFHLKAFGEMADLLHPYARRCVISFLDRYRRNREALDNAGMRAPEESDVLRIAEGFANIAARHGLPIVTCAEKVDLGNFGIEHGACIDDKLVSELTGSEFEIGKDRTQRPECGCIASVDIGSYDTCPRGCLYCYANGSLETVRRNYAAHDPRSPLLFGALSPEDTVTDRKMYSCRKAQRDLL